MSSSFGDNKRKPGAGASAVTEARRLAALAATWTFPSKGPRVTTGTQVAAATARNAGVLGLKYAEQNGSVPNTTAPENDVIVVDFNNAILSSGTYVVNVSVGNISSARFLIKNMKAGWGANFFCILTPALSGPPVFTVKVNDTAVDSETVNLSGVTRVSAQGGVLSSDDGLSLSTTTTFPGTVSIHVFQLL
jgi:hypothetical protein